MNLPETLYHLRKERNMSQLELAEALGVSRQAISKWETGTTVPTLDNVIAISKFFSVPVDCLINGHMHDFTDIEVPNEAASHPKGALKTILLRVLVTAIICICILVVGATVHSFATTLLFLLVVGTLVLIYAILRFIFRFITNLKAKNPEEEG